MPHFLPQELEAHVESQADSVGTKAFLTQRQHNRLREMWCAGRFGRGYESHFGECFVDIDETDEQRDYDFHLLVGSLRLPFQIAEVLDSGRRRGQDYRDYTEDEVAGQLSLLPKGDSAYASARIREALRSKIDKRYAGASSLHILLYLNVNASSVPWASLAEPAAVEAQTFASVWLVTQHLFCCLHGGKQWSGLVGWRAIESAA